MLRAFFMAFMLCGHAKATIYEVGDGRPYPSIGSVPWESLQPGDEVRIHARPAPYHEKWVLCRQGTPTQPIRIVGVPDSLGSQPVIDGEDATTRLALDYWNENRAVLKIGGASIPPDTMPMWIEIHGIDFRGARPPATFTDDAGNAGNYINNAAAIFIEKGEHITIRNCTLRDCGNGLFVASSDSAVSRDILIESCYIHSNGNVGSGFEHNTYTAAIGITYQFNRFGPLANGADGNNLKDRSAGLVVRYNWIEAGNRQLDLVDAEDSSIIATDPRYRSTHVYGNVLLEPGNFGNKQIVHYGGDSGNTAAYRKGMLYFYNNTVESSRSTSTTLFRLSTNDEHCDARNNIFHVRHAANGLSILDSTGVIGLSHNFHRPGWIAASSGLAGVVNDDGTSILADSPEFQNPNFGDYRLAHNSPCIDASGPLDSVVLPQHDVLNLFRPDRQPSPRNRTNGILDIGAYEQTCIGDVNFDFVVDIADLSRVLADFGNPACAASGCFGQVDRIGGVDLADLSLLLSRFGQMCE